MLLVKGEVKDAMQRDRPPPAPGAFQSVSNPETSATVALSLGAQESSF